MGQAVSSTIAIPSILKVGNDTLDEIGRYLKENGLENVVVYFGNGLIAMFGERVLESLRNNSIEVWDKKELESIDIDDIVAIAPIAKSPPYIFNALFDIT